MSKWTVKRRLHAAGMRGCVAVNEPLLSKRPKKRDETGQKSKLTGLEKNGGKFSFTANQRFEVFSSSRQLYARRRVSERYFPKCLAPAVKFGGGKVMVWGCIRRENASRC